jgi:hypothetical protein
MELFKNMVVYISYNLTVTVVFLRSGPRVSAEEVEKMVFKIDQELRTQTANRDEFSFVYKKYEESVILLHEEHSLSNLHRILLAEEPKIVHFYYHDQKEGILSGVESTTVSIERALKEAFSTTRTTIECVIISLNNLDKWAQEICRHVSCVIGIPMAISEDSYADFNLNFYREIALGRSLTDAFEYSIAYLNEKNVPQDQHPQLRTNGNVDLGQVIIIFDKWPVRVTVRSMSVPEDDEPNWYSWAIWVETDPIAFLKGIREVEYHLHPTFKKKDVIINDRAHSFSLLSRGWGEFEVDLDLVLLDGSKTRLRHDLKLGRDKPDETVYELNKGDFSQKGSALRKIKKVIT